MTPRRSIAILFGCTLLFALIGAGAGYSIGRFVPGYYRGVFHGGDQAGFDPVAVGFGQGLTQGIVGGAVAGVVLVAILSWREARLHPVARGGEPGRASRSVAARVLRTTTNVLVLVFGCFVSLMIGVFVGNNGPKHDRYAEERPLVQSILSGDPAFAGVTIDERTYGGGGVELDGQLPTAAAAARLREALVRRIGEARAAELLRGVSVSSPEKFLPATRRSAGDEAAAAAH